MDDSKQYIEMCEKAVEIQQLRGRLKWEAWDYVYASDDGDPEVLVVSGYCTDSGFYGLEAGSEEWPEDECVPKGAIWLPRQDQLQEMVGVKTVGEFENFASGNYMMGWDDGSAWLRLDGYRCDYDSYSLEQFWLCVVMKEKYNKVWNGEDWVND